MSRYTKTEVIKMLESRDFQFKAFYVYFTLGIVGGAQDEVSLRTLAKSVRLFEDNEVEQLEEAITDAIHEVLADPVGERQVKVFSFAPELCLTPEIKDTILEDLGTIIDSDGKINSAELSTYRTIQRYILN